MTFATVRTNATNGALFTQGGIPYIVQYDASNGGGQIIQQNAPAGTLPIYQNGRWNASATQIGLTPQQQNTFHTQTQQLVYSAYQRSGGRSAGSVLGTWAQPSNQGQSPGQTSTNPSQNPSSSTNGSGNGLNAVQSLFAGFSNLPQLASEFQSNGDAFSGAGNESTLFRDTMIYPRDMNIEQQDTLQITGYRYRPSRGATLFGGIDETRNILSGGLQTQSNFNIQQKIGFVILPMPNKVADSNNVSWGEDNMNNLSAAATAAMLSDLPGAAISAGLGAGLNLLTGAGNAQQGVFVKSLIDLAKSGGGGEELSTLLGSSLASKFLKMAGYGVETESILARGAGIIPNSNMELLFKSPTLRTFTFTYKMSPRDEDEASKVRRIIRFFKQSMAAKKITSRGGAAGQASYFLGTPNIFTLEYKTNSRSDGTGGQFIEGVNRFKTCALSSFQCDYTPDGFWAAYQQGQPISTSMSMTFNELEPIYDTDYQENNIFSSRTDLQSVDSESIGY